ncbi:hypothetical protein yc1106_04783 [Curvularia clavata]|uniref:Uncharacterized protein n=1 Tax=Curvularia clavata TaxID=95742 RepID=A0A9Q8Z9T4_CURCL|nr:hypothetical protein yc1106_04783 [Curvularia clavata]
MGNQLSVFFPPAPSFTEASLPDLRNKVYIVTGASAGVGKELSRLLYSRNGTVYLTARSFEKAKAAIAWIKEQHPSSQGKLSYLYLELNDLEGIKTSAATFLAQESRLDVLFNNAGIMGTPKGGKTKQGYEEHLGVNCVAPFLFTKLLTPLLRATAEKEEKKGSVRVVWVSSMAAFLAAPSGGIDMRNLDYKKDAWQTAKYGISKGGNILHALEYRRRYGGDGIVSITLHPGNLDSELSRHLSSWQYLMAKALLYPPVYGAYTELFAGLAPEGATLKESEWVLPWGRVVKLRKDFYSDKGKDNAKAFWEWSEKQVERFT